MKTLIRIIVAAAICMATQSSLAQVTVFGVPDCGQWLKGSHVTKQQHIAWLLGYLSGINGTVFSLRKEAPLNALSSGEQAMAWMDNYCKANPLSDLYDGGGKLLSELGEKAKARK